MTEPDPAAAMLAGWTAVWEDGGPPDPRDDVDTASLIQADPELGSVCVTELDIPGVPARLYRPPTPSTEVLLWAHGGAFVAGSLDMPEANWVGLALAARGVNVVSVDYRKAHRGVHYPAPSDDLLAAWQWVRRHAHELLGGEPLTLHLGGASAGAALAATGVLRLRDDGEQLPASLVLAYPLVHSALPALSADVAARLDGVDPALVFSSRLVEEISLNYVGSRHGLDHPLAFAGNGSLHTHPPTFILNSDRDSLRASGELYARQLAQAGVVVRLGLEPGTTHGHLDQPHSTGARRSIERIAEWLGMRP